MAIKYAFNKRADIILFIIGKKIIRNLLTANLSDPEFIIHLSDYQIKLHTSIPECVHR